MKAIESMKAISLSTASVALAALLFADAAEAAVQAGVSAAVRGKVDLTPVVEKVVRPIDSGEDVFLGDALKSHEQSGMQLMLLDETSITMGPNADLTVDEFIYDPATGIGEVTASLAEGVFRFVTGKTSQGQDKAMTLEVPFGTIGIRGTIGAVRNDALRSLIVLLGPGLNNNANERAGALDITAQGKTVSLTRPGFGTIIEAGQPPSPPFRLTDVQFASILTPLAPPPPLSPEQAPSVEAADRAAQQDIAAAKETSSLTGGIIQGLENLADPFDATTLAAGIGGNITFFSDLPSTGDALYKESSPPLTDGGTYSFEMTVDFGNRTLGGGFNDNFAVNNSTVLGSGSPASQTFFTSSNVQSFDQAAGASAGIPAFTFFGTDGVCDIDFQILLINGGGAAETSLFVNNTVTGDTTSGTGTTSAQPVVGD